MLTTKQKLIVVTQKIKRMESEQTTAENHQIIKEEKKRTKKYQIARKLLTKW